MKFEKISDKKFKTFKRNEVINPILVSGGATDTDNPIAQTHDIIGITGGSNTDYLTTANGNNFTQDNSTTSDETDVT